MKKSPKEYAEEAYKDVLSAGVTMILMKQSMKSLDCIEKVKDYIYELDKIELYLRSVMDGDIDVR